MAVDLKKCGGFHEQGAQKWTPIYHKGYQTEPLMFGIVYDGWIAEESWRRGAFTWRGMDRWGY